MTHIRSLLLVAALLLGAGGMVRAGDVEDAPQVDGLITRASVYPVDVTLDRLEQELKRHGFVIFARLDHTAAAAAAGLKMPPEIVVVFGNPRAGTPNFLQHPTLAIDLPLRALVWQDQRGKVWLSYNSQAFLYRALFARHHAAFDQSLGDRADAALSEVAAKVTE